MNLFFSFGGGIKALNALNGFKALNAAAIYF